MSNSESKDKFLKRLVGFSIGPIVNAVIGFITVPLTTWFLFPEELGKASMYTTAVELLATFIYLGQSKSYSREYNSTKDRSKLLYNCLILPLTLAFLVTIITLLFQQEISNILFGEYSLLGIIIFSLAMPVKIVESFSLNVIRMKEKAKLYSLFQIFKKIVSFTLLLTFFIFIMPTYHAVLIASFGSLLITAIFQIINAWDIWGGALRSRPNKRLLKKVLAYGLPLVPAAALTWVFQSADKIALRNYADFQQIGYYSGAFKVVALLNIIKKSFSSFWMPTSYRWYEDNVPVSRFQKVSDGLMSLFIPFSSIIILLRYVIFHLLSEKYLPSAEVIPFLMFIPTIATVTSTTNMGIQFKRKTHFEIYVSIIVAIINVAGNILLVPRLGAVGASISTGFSFITFFYLRAYISNKLWKKISLGRHTVNILLLSSYASLTIIKGQVLWIEIPLTVLILVYNLKNILYLLKSIKQLMKKRKNKA